MNAAKIDKALLFASHLQQIEGGYDCIVKASKFSSLKKILSQQKIEIKDEFAFINSFLVGLSRSQLFALSNLSEVKFLSSVSTASAQMNVARKILGVEGGTLTGKGVGIAFIDTGISPHSDFCLGQNRILHFKDFIAGKKFPYDDNGHGTFVTGVCSGSGMLSGGKYAGVAPQSKIISIKALSANGEASADKILAAMQWVYDHHKKYEIRVVCMSFGSEPLGYSDPIMAGAEALWSEGIVVVAAAGNSGPEYQTIKSPGVSSKIITVGGFNDNRLDDENFQNSFFEIAEFSSRGPAFSRFKPDLLAPSVDIISCGHKKPYTTLSGTSVATPMIAALSALLIENNPNITPVEVKRQLLLCCRPITYNKNFEGGGYPNLKNLIINKK